MAIKRINEFPEGNGSLTNDDVFLFMDNPEVSGVTKKISLSQIAAAIGGGGGGSDITTGTIDLHNGGVQNAQILQFDNASLQAVITGPTPPSGNSAQRLIIQGQRAINSGEGGDVYIWGGDSDTNGGDIKIYAGDADASPGDGGYVNIEGGNGYANGGHVTLTGGASSENGGDIRLIAGNDNNGGGEIRVTTGNGNNQWVFQNDGFLTIPNSGILLSNNTSVKQGSYDNSTGGQNGISLNCSVGYELNWQGGRLRNTVIGSDPVNGPSSTLYIDSPIEISAGWGALSSSPTTINLNGAGGDTSFYDQWSGGRITLSVADAADGNLLSKSLSINPFGIIFSNGSKLKGTTNVVDLDLADDSPTNRYINASDIADYTNVIFKCHLDANIIFHLPSPAVEGSTFKLILYQNLNDNYEAGFSDPDGNGIRFTGNSAGNYPTPSSANYNVTAYVYEFTAHAWSNNYGSPFPFWLGTLNEQFDASAYG